MPGLILGRLIHVTLVFSRSAGAGESSEIKWREMKRSGHGASAPVHGSVTTDLGFASVDLLLGFHCPSSKVCLSFPPFFFSFHINPHTCVLSCFSCVCPDSAIPWTVAHQGCPWDSQERTLEWVAMASSRGPSRHRDWAHISFFSHSGRWVP